MKGVHLGRTAAAIVAGLVIGAGAPAAERVAVVDAARVLKEYRKTKDVHTAMEQQVAEFNAEGERLMAERDKLKKEFEDARLEAQNKALSENTLNEKRDLAEQKLVQMLEFENKMRETAALRRKQLDEQKIRMHKRLVDEITEAIQQCAAREGVTMVLDSSALTGSGFKTVLHAGTNTDITAAVMQSLSQEEPEAKPAR
jgi:Skp family chaperone for outer membrane proteins